MQQRMETINTAAKCNGERSSKFEITFAEFKEVVDVLLSGGDLSGRTEHSRGGLGEESCDGRVLSALL